MRSQFRLFRRRENRFRHIAFFESVLGTSLELQILSTLKESGQGAEKAILDEIDRLEKIFNAYNASSELSRWQTTFGQDVIVSSEFAEVLLATEQWRQATKGSFNPAVEAFTRIWAAHARKGAAVTAEEISPVLSQVSGPLWQVDAEANTARRLTRLAVTLNSIAKGFIIDRACLVAAAVEGVTDVLINIGGDLRHSGAKPTQVAIADPRSDAENAVPVDGVSLCNQGLATSGDYRRGFQVGEQWFSHIIDPRTGWPVQSLTGVSVIAPSALCADVLATAFSVLEPTESLALADSLDHVGVFLIAASGQQFSNSFWNEHRGNDYRGNGRRE